MVIRRRSESFPVRAIGASTALGLILILESNVIANVTVGEAPTVVEFPKEGDLSHLNGPTVSGNTIMSPIPAMGLSSGDDLLAKAAEPHHKAVVESVSSGILVLLITGLAGFFEISKKEE